MKIGVVKEIKANENRVGVTPAGVAAFAAHGHEVLIEAGAGLGSMITDADYAAAGAVLVPDRAKVWGASDMILKVKEPLAEEYPLLRPGLLLFTYLHLAAEEKLTRSLLEKGVTGIAYETVQLANGSLPLLAPMSEVAGRMAVQIGAMLLVKHAGGMGVLLGGVPGVHAGHVVIVGGGVVGANAAKMAIGLGARVTILDSSVDRLRYLDDIFGARCQTVASSAFALAEQIASADLLVGAVLIPGAKAPKLVTESMVKTMKPGSVIVDVAIDQGGSVETIDRATTHANPTYVRHGVVHYSVANIPGAVPRTSTFALTNATLPYALRLADLGWQQACRENRALGLGVNTAGGKCICGAVGEAFGLTCATLASVLA
ncbi:MAG: alanine dehydrogenase [Desulfovibrio sp.]|jgi:alanine dehydrogenase|nr:alanine dehydrogenase [Desulfovibrio sp.]